MPDKPSAQEEWAKRQLAYDDAAHDALVRDWKWRAAQEAKFRQRHPWLARLWYGVEHSRNSSR